MKCLKQIQSSNEFMKYGGAWEVEISRNRDGDLQQNSLSGEKAEPLYSLARIAAFRPELSWNALILHRDDDVGWQSFAFPR